MRGCVFYCPLRPRVHAYRAFFSTIIRHKTCKNPGQWIKRLEAGGFKVERYLHYFSPTALAPLSVYIIWPALHS